MPTETSKCRILVVDDEHDILTIVEGYLSRHGYRVTKAPGGAEAIELINDQTFDIVISDLKMPRVDGMRVLQETKRIRPETEVIILTGFGTIDSAVQALRHGSYDYMEKPIEFERLRRMIDRILEKRALETENVLIKRRLKERYQYDGLVGSSPQIREIYDIIDRIGNSLPTVLIHGESGTGKELAANVIHQNSPRRDRPFVPVNCGAIVGNLLESELFGHVKGSFTGAIRDAMGLFKAADGGTIFLDEITEIDPHLQVKLLRVLQERTIRSVGATREEPIDVRVIAATNRDPKEILTNKILREDLYYRLNVVSIRMPPLRTMKDDIPLLVHHFLQKFIKRGEKHINGITTDALDLMDAFHWPGNIRQLENVIERAVVLGLGDTIDGPDLPAEIRHGVTAAGPTAGTLNLRDNETHLIRQALIQTQWNKAHAAALLGVNTTTVYRKMEKYRIVPPTNS